MNEVKEAIVQRLRKCSFPAYLHIVHKTLIRAGFGDVQLLDRFETYQKSRYGGHEIECFVPCGSRSIKVVVKVIKDRIRIRMLDELVGVLNRCGGEMALIVSPFIMGDEVAIQSTRYNTVSLDVIDEVDLVRLMSKHTVGVRRNGELDYAYFEALEEDIAAIRARRKAKRMPKGRGKRR